MKRSSTDLDYSHFTEAQQKAIQILQKCNPKPVVVVDLDYTLWPVNCFEHTAAPYSASIRTPRGITKPSSPTQLFCRDRRTKEFTTLNLYPESREVLDWCVENSLVLSICSKSPDRGLVEKILTAFGMWEWFLLPQIYYARTKTYHFRNLSDVVDVKYTDYLFFDDDPNNIRSCASIGVTTMQVNKATGLNWSSFIDGLQSFQANQASRNSFQGWLKKSVSQSIFCQPALEHRHEDQSQVQVRAPARVGQVTTEGIPSAPSSSLDIAVIKATGAQQYSTASSSPNTVVSSTSTDQDEKINLETPKSQQAIVQGGQTADNDHIIASETNAREEGANAENEANGASMGQIADMAPSPSSRGRVMPSASTEVDAQQLLTLMHSQQGVDPCTHVQECPLEPLRETFHPIRVPMPMPMHMPAAMQPTGMKLKIDTMSYDHERVLDMIPDSRSLSQLEAIAFAVEVELSQRGVSE